MYRYCCAIEVSILVEVSITYAINTNVDDSDEAYNIIMMMIIMIVLITTSTRKKYQAWTNTLYFIYFSYLAWVFSGID